MMGLKTGVTYHASIAETPSPARWGGRVATPEKRMLTLAGDQLHELMSHNIHYIHMVTQDGSG